MVIWPSRIRAKNKLSLSRNKNKGREMGWSKDRFGEISDWVESCMCEIVRKLKFTTPDVFISKKFPMNMIMVTIL